uniref:Uncharacterized protein n=1 Tax=viral metagenome TaxID=1070528 RepID=A0A6C0C9L4_9ZZZZ
MAHQSVLVTNTHMNPKIVPQEEILAISDFLSQNDVPAKSRITYTVESHGCNIKFDNKVVQVTYFNNKINCVWEDGIIVQEKFENLLMILIEIITKGTLINHCLETCQNYYCTSIHPPTRQQICKNLQCAEDKCFKIHADGRERCMRGWDCLFKGCHLFHPVERKIDFPGDNISTNPFLSAVPSISNNPFLSVPVAAPNNPFFASPQNPFLVPRTPSPPMYAPVPQRTILADDLKHETPLVPIRNSSTNVPIQKPVETVVFPVNQKPVETVSIKVPTEKIVAPNENAQLCKCKDEKCIQKHMPWCKYDVSCRGYNGSCKFRHHEKVICRCDDESCVKVHVPWCRYGDKCKNPSCTYRHTIAK